ncbi:TetR/AcrR family transcriptional regulator [Granulicella arctica]|uniref:TetR/AcrR family transcriptional regulator n=1 Tax=Granulicella arctica TaxID=940613 RepID=UPI0021E06110|nr:TetR/AcrR family transcriptional regulator [Granulicella arctica]
MTKGEQTRQRIIAEAAPIFNQRGFAGCSMQDIMDATGMEKGGLYRHFSSKEELAVESLRYALAKAVRSRTEKVEEIQGAVEKLRHLIRHFVESPSVIPGGCPLMNTAIDSDDGNPALRALACDGIQVWKTRLCRILEAGIERGEIGERVLPRQIANTIIATLEGALMISRLEGTQTALEDAHHSLDDLLSGLATS